MTFRRAITITSNTGIFVVPEMPEALSGIHWPLLDSRPWRQGIGPRTSSALHPGRQEGEFGREFHATPVVPEMPEALSGIH